MIYVDIQISTETDSGFVTADVEKETYLVAEGWQELTARQFADAVTLVSKYDDEMTLRANALRLFFPEELFRRKVAIDALADQVLPLLQWICQPPEEMPQLLPEIRTPIFRRFPAPAADFTTLTISEFHFAEQALFELLEAPDDLTNLYWFVATLYRPHGGRGAARRADKRREFDDSTVRQRAELFRKHVPENVARAVVFWYRHTRKLIADRYPRLFNGGQGAATNEAPSYFRLMRALAEKGTYGTFPDVEKLLLLNVFEELEAAIDEQEEREAREPKPNL